MTDGELVERHIEQHPYHPGPANARLVDAGTEVWLIVAYAHSVEWNLGEVAETFGISLESVRAACAYYSRHQALIDARIALDHAAFS